MRDARLFVAGRWTDGATTAVVDDKYTHEPVTLLHLASREQTATATAYLDRARHADRLTPYDRFQVLAAASRLVRERRDALADLIVTDTGFTTADADREIDRAEQTLLLSAEEARRLCGEVVPLDGAPGGSGRLAFTIRRPRGVVCAVTPFNSPLNTVAHKVGPALAAGNAVVLKPAAATPLTANALVEILLDAGLPAGLVALVHGDGATVGQWLLEDPIPAFYAFTGSTAVGERIRHTIGLRPSQLELGSLSSTIICADAEIGPAVARCVTAAFRKAGQVCTSVQRLYVQRAVLDDVIDSLGERIRGARAGDPRDPDVFIGPVISAAAGERIGRWIDEAVRRGACRIAGGERDCALVQPTVLADVPADAEVMCREVFGPVVSIRPFDDLEDAIDEVNDTPYGLAAGIFTRDIHRALRAAEELHMGSVHINETSSSRVDLMPYQGAKLSGMGVEGPHYAVREMTEERLITIGRP